jgi:hypothetical protein
MKTNFAHKTYIAALFLLSASIALPASAAPVPYWDTEGNYVVDFEYQGNFYSHDMTLQQDNAGTLLGEGGYPAGGSHVYSWEIDSGQVSGNDLNFVAHYTASADAVTPLTILHATGTVASDGTMSGTWSDNYQGGSREGTWSTASGTATKIVDTTAPAVPTHLSPVNGSTHTSAALTEIDWSTVTDPSSPVVYYYESSLSSATDGDGSFTTPAYESGALSDSKIGTAGTPEGTYYWHVRAVDNAGNSSAWSAPWSVIVNNTVTPPPTGPSDKDQCKGNGWKTFTNPSFKNQGQCVSWHNHQ